MRSKVSLPPGLLRWLGLLLLLTGLAFPGTAPAAERIHPRCQIAAPPKADIAAILALPVGECVTPSATHPRGTVWLDYRDTDFLIGQDAPWRLMIDNHRVRAVDLYLVRADRSVEHVAYDPASPDRAWSPGGYFALPIAHRGSDVTRMLVRLGDTETVSLVRAAKAMPEREAVATDRSESALYGIAVGMLGVTILFHLVLFSAIRRRFQLVYCAHVSLLFGYGLVSSSLILLPFPGLSGEMLSRLLGFTMALATVSAIAFILDFLEAGAIPDWLRRWAWFGASLSTAAALALLAAPPRWTAPVYVLSNTVAAHALAIITAILLVACARGSATARILAVGWLLPLVVAALYPLRQAGLIDAGVIPDGAMLAALTIECMILSLPVANRIKALRIDHERARERQSVLERQAGTDSLTGLANRRGFAGAIERSFGGATSSKQAALMMIDIDHFKAINDRHGHGHGDQILKRVADHVARTAGGGAVVARYGGEEFVVALAGYDAKRAGTLAERIRIGIEALELDRNAPALGPVTVSIGVASGPSETIDALIGEADDALYEAKRAGRNRVVVATAAEHRTIKTAAA